MRLVWVDTETTGLGADCHLLEVAVAVTDSDLRLVEAPLSLLVRPPRGALEDLEDVVRDMHTRSGLLDALERGGGVDPSQVDDHLGTYVRSLTGRPRTAHLAGSSVHFDRGVLARYAPGTLSHLHHRVVDVSTLKVLALAWRPDVAEAAPAKRLAHRAESDLLESVDELAAYRRWLS